MPDWKTIDWITVVGTLVTLIALWVALRQGRRTASTVEAGLLASEATQKAIRFTGFLIDAGKTSATLEELRTLIQHARYEAAVIRAQDLTKQLIFLRESQDADAVPDFEFRTAITEIAMIRDHLYHKVQDKRRTFPQVPTLTTLSDWSDQLAGLTGVAAYSDHEVLK
jgi:hypothetical protein